MKRANTICSGFGKLHFKKNKIITRVISSRMLSYDSYGNALYFIYSKIVTVFTYPLNSLPLTLHVVVNNSWRGVSNRTKFNINETVCGKLKFRTYQRITFSQPQVYCKINANTVEIRNMSNEKYAIPFGQKRHINKHVLDRLRRLLASMKSIIKEIKKRMVKSDSTLERIDRILGCMKQQNLINKFKRNYKRYYAEHDSRNNREE